LGKKETLFLKPIGDTAPSNWRLESLLEDNQSKVMHITNCEREKLAERKRRGEEIRDEREML
jgi:hypothetical protein